MALYNDSTVKIWMYHVASIKLITSDGEITDLPPIRLKQMQMLEDYHSFVLPIFKVVMILEPSLYYKILKNKDTCKIYLRIDKYFRKPNGKEKSMYHNFLDDTFDLVLDDSTDDLLFSQKADINKNNYSYLTQSDRGDLQDVANEIEFFLFKTRSLEGIKSNNVNVILKKATIADAIAYLVTKAHINNVLFAQPDNIEEYDIILIPPLPVLQAFKHLDLYYGLYKTGSILYFGIKYTYIIPFNGRCVAYTPDENRRVTMVIAKTSDIYHTNILGELAKSDESNTYVLGDYKTLNARNESITNNYVIGNDVDMMDAYTGISTVASSNATAKTKNFTKLLENKTENKFIASMYTAQARSGSSVISVMLQNIDVECIAPNKEYQVLFEDSSFSDKYKGRYMISRATHTFMNTGDDFTVDTTCEFRRE